MASNPADNYRLQNLRSAYFALEERVLEALHTCRGNPGSFHRYSLECAEYLGSAETHCAIFPQEEYARLIRNISSMLEQIELASTTDPERSERQPILVFSRSEPSRKGGRPRIQIDDLFLKQVIQLKGFTGIAKSLGCSARTVRRRAADLHITRPGQSVFLPGTGDRRPRQGLRPTRHSDISDHQLDAHVFSILQVFPNYGRSMVAGQLASRGMIVSRARIQASLRRVRGVPLHYGRRRIARKKYWVPAVNSLWHHDGQHGLIRWKMVTHGFIDGKSRLVTGLRVHNNNRASTVLGLFHQATARYGIPRRVRGDHGVENVDVAEQMDLWHGRGRGAYIFGRSVHNTRIERLWLEWTQGLGVKWYDFFMSLEVHYNLDVDNSLHVWLLHHLFLEVINAEAQDWVRSWNSHTLNIRGEPSHSPEYMWIDGQRSEGAHGLLESEDLTTYGVDFEAQRDRRIMTHLLENNPQERSGAAPEQLTEVICDPPECILTDGEIVYLDAHMHQRGLNPSRTLSMDARKVSWQEALRVVNYLVSQ